MSKTLPETTGKMPGSLDLPLPCVYALLPSFQLQDHILPPLTRLLPNSVKKKNQHTFTEQLLNLLVFFSALQKQLEGSCSENYSSTSTQADSSVSIKLIIISTECLTKHCPHNTSLKIYKALSQDLRSKNSGTEREEMVKICGWQTETPSSIFSKLGSLSYFLIYIKVVFHIYLTQNHHEINRT